MSNVALQTIKIATVLTTFWNVLNSLKWTPLVLPWTKWCIFKITLILILLSKMLVFVHSTLSVYIGGESETDRQEKKEKKCT